MDVVVVHTPITSARQRLMQKVYKFKSSLKHTVTPDLIVLEENVIIFDYSNLLFILYLRKLL